MDANGDFYYLDRTGDTNIWRSFNSETTYEEGASEITVNTLGQNGISRTQTTAGYNMGAYALNPKAFAESQVVENGDGTKTYTVNPKDTDNYGDTINPFDGLLTIREAIQLAQDGDTIVSAGVKLHWGSLVVDKDLNFVGNGKNGNSHYAMPSTNMAITVSYGDRFFTITDGANVSMKNMYFMGGGQGLQSDNPADPTTNYGGSILVSGGSTLTLESVSINGQKSGSIHSYQGYADRGGGIAVIGNSTLIGKDVDFAGLKSENYGHAIYAENSTVTLDDAYFYKVGTNASGTQNPDPTKGIGVIYGNNSTIMVTNSEFFRNQSVNGKNIEQGPLYAGSNGSVAVFKNIVATENQIGKNGMFYLHDTASSLTVENANFVENTVTNEGAILYVTAAGANATFINITATDNTATQGMFYINAAANVNVYNSTLYKNAGSAFVLANAGAVLTLANDTIVESALYGIDNTAGGTVRVLNSILADNVSGDIAGDAELRYTLYGTATGTVTGDNNIAGKTADDIFGTGWNYIANRTTDIYKAIAPVQGSLAAATNTVLVRYASGNLSYSTDGTAWTDWLLSGVTSVEDSAWTVLDKDANGNDRTTVKVAGASAYIAVPPDTGNVVTTDGDNFYADGKLTLREAITTAAEGSEITFSKDFDWASVNYTIMLDAELASLIIDRNITINGYLDGTNQITVSVDAPGKSNGAWNSTTSIYSLMVISSDAAVTLKNITLVGGGEKAGMNGSLINASGSGTAITLNNVTVTRTGNPDGGYLKSSLIYANGIAQLHVLNSIFTDNKERMIQANNVADLKVSYTSFVNNTIANVVYASGGTKGVIENTAITNTKYSGNGLLYFTGTGTDILVKNVSVTGSDFGGGDHTVKGSGTTVLSGATGTFVNYTVAFNQGSNYTGHGTGMYIENATVNLIDSTIVANHSNSNGAGLCGGLVISGANAKLNAVNTVILSNFYSKYDAGTPSIRDIYAYKNVNAANISFRNVVYGSAGTESGWTTDPLSSLTAEGNNNMTVATADISKYFDGFTNHKTNSLQDAVITDPVSGATVTLRVLRPVGGEDSLFGKGVYTGYAEDANGVRTAIYRVTADGVWRQVSDNAEYTPGETDTVYATLTDAAGESRLHGVPGAVLNTPIYSLVVNSADSAAGTTISFLDDVVTLHEAMYLLSHIGTRAGDITAGGTDVIGYNAESGIYEITFDSSVFTEEMNTIHLPTTYTAASGNRGTLVSFSIDGDVDSDGDADITIDFNQNNRQFFVLSGVTASETAVHNVVMTNILSNGAGNGTIFRMDGKSNLLFENVTIKDSNLPSCSLFSRSGIGTLTLLNSTITGISGTEDTQSALFWVNSGPSSTINVIDSTISVGCMIALERTMPNTSAINFINSVVLVENPDLTNAYTFQATGSTMKVNFYHSVTGSNVATSSTGSVNADGTNVTDATAAAVFGSNTLDSEGHLAIYGDSAAANAGALVGKLNGSYYCLNGNIWVQTGVADGALTYNYDPTDTATFGLKTETVNGTIYTADQAGNSRMTETGKYAAGSMAAKELASLVVTTTKDLVNAYDGVTSLREAVTYAQTLQDNNTVTFSTDVDWKTAGMAVTLDSAIVINGNVSIDGSLGETGNVTIQVKDTLESALDLFVSTQGGSNAASLTAQELNTALGVINGNAFYTVSDYRLFEISGGTVEMSNMALRGGMLAASGDYGGTMLISGGTVNMNNMDIAFSAAEMFGGAIYNKGTLTITGSVLSHSAVLNNQGRGGSIQNTNGGKLTITDSEMNRNYGIYGGAIRNENGSLMTEAVTFSNNQGTYGGAISTNNINLNIKNSLFTGNEAMSGAAIDTTQNVDITVINSTFTGNKASDNGGAIRTTGGSVYVINSTITGNTAANGGAVYAENGTVVLLNSIVANNTATAANGGADLNSKSAEIYHSVYGEALYNTTDGTLTAVNATVLTADQLATLFVKDADGNIVYENGIPTIDKNSAAAANGTLVAEYDGAYYYLNGTDSKWYKAGEDTTAYGDFNKTSATFGLVIEGATLTAENFLTDAQPDAEGNRVSRVSGIKSGKFSAGAYYISTVFGSLVVNNLTDIVDEDESTNSLREAIEYALAIGGGEITFSADALTSSLNPADNPKMTIKLNSTLNITEELSGTLSINGWIDLNKDGKVDDNERVILDGGNTVTVGEDGYVTSYGTKGKRIFLVKDTNTSDAVAFTGTFSLNNLILQNAYHSSKTDSDKAGSVIHQRGGSLLMANCDILYNTAVIGNSMGGAAIYLNGVKFNISDSLFQGNGFTSGTTYASGGALFITGSKDTNNAITNTDFINNVAARSSGSQKGGGAIALWGGTVVTITDAEFTGNKAIADSSSSGHGGAIYLNGKGSTLTITGAEFYNNTADYNGGAILIEKETILNISNSTFTGNTATNGSGGAIYATEANSTISDSYFTENSAVNGGAGYFQGWGTILTVKNSSFTYNKATGENGVGGALYLADANDNNPNETRSEDGVWVANSTFYGNSAAYGGGVAYNNGGTGSLPYFRNLTIAGNTATKMGGGFFARFAATNSITISNSIILGNKVGTADGDFSVTENVNDKNSHQLTITDSIIGVMDHGGFGTTADGFNLVSTYGPYKLTLNGTVYFKDLRSIKRDEVGNFNSYEMEVDNKLTDADSNKIFVGDGGTDYNVYLAEDGKSVLLRQAGKDILYVVTTPKLSTDQKGNAWTAAENGKYLVGAVDKLAENLSLVVDTNVDVVDAYDGKTSLREAIEFAQSGGATANWDSDGDGTMDGYKITFANGVDTIILSDELRITENVAISIQGNLDADGNLLTAIRVETTYAESVADSTKTASTYRLFKITGGTTVQVKDALLMGGHFNKDRSVSTDTSGSENGGGLFFVNSAGTTLELINVEAKDSHSSPGNSDNIGGAIHVRNAAAVNISDSYFHDIKGVSAATLYYQFASSCTLTLTNTLIDNVDADVMWRTIYIRSGNALIDNVVIKNSYTNKGGTIYVAGGTTEISNSTFINNNNAEKDIRAATILVRNSTNSTANVILHNNTFYNNANNNSGVTPYGAVIVVDNTTSFLTAFNNTIVSNTGNGIYMTKGGATLINNIITGNSFTDILATGGVLTAHNNVYGTASVTADVTYNYATLTEVMTALGGSNTVSTVEAEFGSTPALNEDGTLTILETGKAATSGTLVGKLDGAYYYLDGANWVKVGDTATTKAFDSAVENYGLGDGATVYTTGQNGGDRTVGMNYGINGVYNAGAYAINSVEERSLVVDNTADDINSFDGKTSLREAIAFAQSGDATANWDSNGDGTADGYKITFSADVDWAALGSVIVLDETLGEFQISSNISIDGSLGEAGEITIKVKTSVYDKVQAYCTEKGIAESDFTCADTKALDMTGVSTHRIFNVALNYNFALSNMELQGGSLTDLNGGVIFVEKSSKSVLTLNNVDLLGGKTNTSGGLIYAESINNVIMDDVSLAYGYAGSQGAAYVRGLTMTDSRVFANASDDVAGGIYSAGINKISGSVFRNNAGGQRGGGAFGGNGIFYITDTLFDSNSDGGSWFSRGAGAVFGEYYGNTKITMINCTITGHTTYNERSALFGFSYHATGSTLSLINCTVTGNKGIAGLVDFNEGLPPSITLVNNIIMDNGNSNGDAVIYLPQAEGTALPVINAHYNVSDMDLSACGTHNITSTAAETFGQNPTLNADGTFTILGTSKAAISGTLAGTIQLEINWSPYYQAYFLNLEDNNWYAEDGTLLGAFNAEDTVTYGLTGGVVYTTGQNSVLDSATGKYDVTRVDVLDQFNAGAYILKAENIADRTVVDTEDAEVINRFDGKNTLAEALAYANATAGQETITFMVDKVNVNDNMALNVADGVVIDGGESGVTINVADGKTLAVAEDKAVTVEGTLALNGTAENNGTLNVADGAVLTVDDFTNNGSMSVTGDLAKTADGTFASGEDSSVTYNGSGTTQTILSGEGVTYADLVIATTAAEATGAITAANITVNKDKSLTAASIETTKNVTANGTMDVSGAATVGGNLTANADVTVNGNATVTGDLNANAEVTVDGNATVTGNMNANANVTVNGNVSVDGATAVASGVTLDLNGAEADLGTISNSGSITVSGDMTSSNTADASMGDVTYDGTDGQQIAAGMYDDLTVTAGSKSTSGDITVSGNADMNAALSTDDNVAFNGTVEGSGSVNATAGSVSYGETAGNVLGGIYNNVTVNGDAATTNNITVNGAADVDGKLSTDDNVTFSGTVSGDGSINATAGSVSYGEAAGNVLGGTYNDVTVSGDATTTNNITVNGAADVDGKLTTDDNVAFSGTVEGSGSINATAGSVSYGEAAGNVLGGTYNDVTVSGNATTTDNITVNGAADVDGKLSTDDSVAFNGAVSGDGSINATAGSVSYGEAAGNVLGGTYNDVTVSGEATTTNNITVNGAADVDGKLSTDDSVAFNGAVSGDGSINATAGSVSYNGTGDQTILNGSYNALALENGSKTLGGDVTVSTADGFKATGTTLTGKAGATLTVNDSSNYENQNSNISGTTFQDIAVKNTATGGDGNLYINADSSTPNNIAGTTSGIRLVAELTVTAGAITYGDTMGSIILTVTNASGEQLYKGTADELGWNWAAGNDAIEKATENQAYSVDSGESTYYYNGDVNVVINKRVIQVKAQSYTITAGDALPKFLYSYIGELVGVDAFTGALICSGDGSAAGTYQILQGSLTLGDNYEIVFSAGTLTVEAAPESGGKNAINATQMPDQYNNIIMAEPDVTYQNRRDLHYLYGDACMIETFNGSVGKHYGYDPGIGLRGKTVVANTREIRLSHIVQKPGEGLMPIISTPDAEGNVRGGEFSDGETTMDFLRGGHTREEYEWDKVDFSDLLEAIDFDFISKNELFEDEVDEAIAEMTAVIV